MEFRLDLILFVLDDVLALWRREESPFTLLCHLMLPSPEFLNSHFHTFYIIYICIPCCASQIPDSPGDNFVDLCEKDIHSTFNFNVILLPFPFFLSVGSFGVNCSFFRRNIQRRMGRRKEGEIY